MEIVKNYLDKFFENEYTGTILSVMLVLYGGLAAPKLPGFIKKLFENAIFRILILSLVAYGGNKNPKVAIVIAIAFIISMNYIRENDFVENFADHSDDDDDDDDDDDNSDEDTDIAEEEEMNECKKHIHVVFNIYKESKNDDIIELGEKWRDYHKKKIEVTEKRSNLTRLMCDSVKSLKEKKAERTKVEASDSSDKKEELKDIDEEIKEKVKEIKDIKKELTEYRKSEKEEIVSLKKEFTEERKALRLRLAKEPKAFKKYKEVEKKIKTEVKNYKKICRQIYKLKCEDGVNQEGTQMSGSGQMSDSGQMSGSNSGQDMNSNTSPSQNSDLEQFNKKGNSFENSDVTTYSSEFENMNDIPVSEIPN